MRLAFAGLAAALLAGCADSGRFTGDPLGNPFHSASNAPAPASNAGYDREMSAPPPYRPTRTAAIQSSRLAPPSEPEHRVARYEAPRPQPVHEERYASVPAPSGHGGWSSDGGMTVIAGNGESAHILAQRYNVPEEVLLRSNGFASAASVHAGTRLVIPVYSANGGTQLARSEPVRHERPHEEHVASREPVPHEHKGRERLMARHEVPEAKPVRMAKVEEAETHGRMKWVKGPQPVRMGEAKEPKGHGREAVMARLDKKHDQQVAALEKKQAEQAARRQALHDEQVARLEQKKAQKAIAVADARPARGKKAADTQLAQAEPVHDKPQRMAKLEQPAKAAAVDPTPTASLPPQSEKIAAAPSASGNPEFRWPAHGRIIQGFKSGGNDGINIAVPEGTAVKAAEAGTVAYAGNEIKGFGNLVLIRHPNGYVTAYANNGDIEVHRGETVKRGQTIAKSGQSGNVASPQLHFELRKGSTPVDPTRYLAGL